MASSGAQFEEKLTCSICLCIFNNPVILRCGHSFCNGCISTNWSQSTDRGCPLCRQVPKRSPFKNLALKEVCEFVVEAKRCKISESPQGLLCDIHDLKLELFCTDDQKLVCMKCVDQNHKQHNFCTISKAAEEHKNKLQKPLQELQSQRQTLKRQIYSLLININTTLQSQGQETESRMKEEFEKLHQFLRDEEAVRISELRDEQKRKKEEMIRKTDGVDTALLEQIKNVKDDFEKDDIHFLHNLRDTEEKVKFTVLVPKLDSGCMIDAAEHLGNLNYKVREKMKHLCPFYPVLLDSNTKTRNHEKFEDFTSMASSGIHALINQEKPILGSEGFSSGVHTWEVSVKGCEQWALGVVPESEKSFQNLSNSSFLVSCIKGKCSWTSVASRIERVCVSLDMLKCQVVFSDPDNKVTMKSYERLSKEKMYPCFFPLSNIPMKILPSNMLG